VTRNGEGRHFIMPSNQKRLPTLLFRRSWRDSDPSGANSIAWYNDYLADPSNESGLQRILVYNEDDCRAMVAVKEYFQKALDA